MASQSTATVPSPLGREVLTAKEATLLENLTSDKALSGDVHTFLLCAVLSSQQEGWAQTVRNKL
jgi:hypothetical protein